MTWLARIKWRNAADHWLSAAQLGLAGTCIQVLLCKAEMLFKGIYEFGGKRVACRNDYCTVCRSERLIEGQRKFAFVYVFFVPVLPIGAFTRWFCTACRRPPTEKAPDSAANIVLYVLFGIAGLAAGITMLTIGKEDPYVCWFCILAGVGAFLLVWAESRKDRAGYAIARASVNPLRGNYCPFCNVRLLAGPKRRCHVCGVKVLTDVGKSGARRITRPVEPPPLPPQPPLL